MPSYALISTVSERMVASDCASELTLRRNECFRGLVPSRAHMRSKARAYEAESGDRREISSKLAHIVHSSFLCPAITLHLRLRPATPTNHTFLAILQGIEVRQVFQHQIPAVQESLLLVLVLASLMDPRRVFGYNALL